MDLVIYNVWLLLIIIGNLINKRFGSDHRGLVWYPIIRKLLCDRLIRRHTFFYNDSIQFFGNNKITVLKTNDRKPVINGRPFFSLRNNGLESSGH